MKGADRASSSRLRSFLAPWRGQGQGQGQGQGYSLTHTHTPTRPLGPLVRIASHRIPRPDPDPEAGVVDDGALVPRPSLSCPFSPVPFLLGFPLSHRAAWEERGGQERWLARARTHTGAN